MEELVVQVWMFQVTTSVNNIQNNRPQDAIASILASMNTTGADFAGDVVSVTGLGEDRPEMVPLNLATSGGQVATIQQPQTVQVQGYKKLGQASQLAKTVLRFKYNSWTLSLSLFSDSSTMTARSS